MMKRKAYSSSRRAKRARPSYASPPLPRSLSLARNTEVKYVDFSLQAPTIAGTLNYVNITEIGVGGQVSQRIGNQVRILGFDINGAIGYPESQLCSQWLLMGKTTTVPSTTYLSGANPSGNWNISMFKRLYKQVGSAGWDYTINHKFRFRTPLLVSYLDNATNTPQRNPCYFVMGAQGSITTGGTVFIRTYFIEQ